MAPITEHVDIHKPQKPKLGGGGPGKIPHVRGFGGGDDGDSDRDRPEGFLSSKDRLRRYRIAIVLGVISITALFIGLTIVYIMRQGMGRWDVATKTFIHDWQAVALPYPLLFVNTSVLLLSSVTLELARRKLSMNSEFAVMGIRPPRLQSELPWLAITVLLGCGFLAGQIDLVELVARRRASTWHRTPAVRSSTCLPDCMPSTFLGACWCSLQPL